MKPRLLFLASSVLVGLLSVARADSILLSDDFSGPSLDVSKWTTLGPGSVTQGGGCVTTIGRGILATADGFDGPYVINGTFTMLDGLEHFNIGFRTDLSTSGAPYYESSGMLVSFSNDGDQISIQRYASPTDWNLLAVKSFALTTGVSYFFSIFDDGTNIDFAVNGVYQLSATSTYATGNQIAFSSREFGAGSKLDAVTITRVPDAGITALYITFTLLGLVIVGKRRIKSCYP